MKPSKILTYDENLENLKILELSFQPSKRTVNKKSILFPELIFKIPYHEINDKFYLTGGLCYVAAIVDNKEYFIKLNNNIFEPTDNVCSIEYYRNFAEKFNIKGNYVYCYSAELHDCAMEFSTFNDLKNWFGNNFFYSYGEYVSEKWKEFKTHDHEFYKFITNDFCSTG